jgi:hypothetical protein
MCDGRTGHRDASRGIFLRTLQEHSRRSMFFRFPPDARWNPECSVVEFGIGVGEYEGVVRVSRRTFQILLPEAPYTRTMPRSLPPSPNPARTHSRAESSAAAVDRRRQRRDHRSRSERTRRPGASRAPHRISPGCFMRATQQGVRDAKGRIPVRIRIAVPPEGFGSRLDQIFAWFDAIGVSMGWTSTPLCGPFNRARGSARKGY